MKKPSIISRLFRPEAKGLANPDSGLLGLFGLAHIGMGGGVPLSRAEALRVAPVAAAMRVISEAVACLDVQIRDASGAIIEAHPVGDMLRGGVNGWTSGYELLRDLVIDALSDDRGGLAYVNRVGDEVREIIRYRDGVFDVQVDQNTGEPSYKIGNAPIAPADVIHLRAPFGKAPLTLAMEAIGVAWVLQRHANNLFEKGAKPSGYLSIPAGIGQEAINSARAAWKATQEGHANAGGTAILYDGMTFEGLTLNSTDAQFLENRKFQIAEIARAFRVPPSMLFDLDRATWGNTEQMGREFLTYCLEPWLRALEGALARALFSGDEAGYRVHFDRDDMTRADLQTRATTISSIISAKVMTPKEGRSWVGLPPRDDAPDEFENPHINTNDTAPPDAGAGNDGGQDAQV